MTHDHPAIDDLADYSADLLPEQQTAGVRTHVEACAACRDTLDALGDVSDVLGSTPAPPMPVDVSERLDAAIAAESHERATGVVSLAAKRRDATEGSADRPATRRTNAFRIVGAAAATLVVLGVAGSWLISGDDETTAADGSPSTSSEMTPSSAQEAPADGGSGVQVVSSDLTMRTPSDVRDAAERIASGQVGASVAASCSLPSGVPSGATSALTSYRDERAVIMIDASSSRVWVYDCAGTTRLFSGRY